MIFFRDINIFATFFFSTFDLNFIHFDFLIFRIRNFLLKKRYNNFSSYFQCLFRIGLRESLLLYIFLAEKKEKTSNLYIYENFYPILFKLLYILYSNCCIIQFHGISSRSTKTIASYELQIKCNLIFNTSIL